MKLTTDLVGVHLGTLTKEITVRQAMNFAASVGDGNPAYFDDDRPEGVIAPPMLVVSLTWPLAVAYTDTLRERGFETAIRRQVHYTEHIVWNRVFRPGEVLTIDGDVVAILPHTAGTFGVVQFRATDAAGELVFTEMAGALFRGVRCEGESGGYDCLPPVPERKEEPEALWVDVVHMDPLAAHVYDGCADLHFPIHTSKQFARKVGLPGTIIHGTCTQSVAVREIVNREAAGDPSRLRSTSCRFTGMVMPGTDIAIRLMGEDTTPGSRHLFYDVMNGDGKKAISEGHVEIAM